jgi:RNA polymerase sigma-70 factor (ECF subfamily)
MVRGDEVSMIGGILKTRWPSPNCTQFGLGERSSQEDFLPAHSHYGASSATGVVRMVREVSLVAAATHSDGLGHPAHYGALRFLELVARIVAFVFYSTERFDAHDTFVRGDRLMHRDAADRSAEFERLSLPIANTLYATAYRLTGNAARAEDLVQETYVLAWQKFDSFKTGTNFKAWLFRVLILISKNEGRVQRKQPAALSEETERNLAQRDDTSAPTDAAAKLNYDDFVDDDFKRALDRLDGDHRTILMLVTLGELSYQECAESLALPIGTVMSRLHRARKQLQGELTQYAQERGLLRGVGAGEKQ